jgi:type IV secretion system protein VirB10
MQLERVILILFEWIKGLSKMSENNNTTENKTEDGGAMPSLNDLSKNKPLGIPEGQKKPKSNVSKLIFVGLLVIGFVFVIGGLVLYQKHKAKAAPHEKTAIAVKKTPWADKNKALQNESIEDIKTAELKQQAEDIKTADLKKQAEDAAAADKAATDQKAYVAAHPAGAAGTPAAGSPVALAQTPHDRKMTGDALFDISASNKKGDGATDKLTSLIGGIGQPSAATAVSGLFPQAQAQPVQQNGIAAQLQPTSLANGKVGRLSNLDYLLKRGTVIPCALKTGIDTTLAGFVLCSVTNDVYSANDKTLLIERGASIFGEQQSSVKHGQARVFVLWTRIDNPDGTYAELDSPATDAMGFNGIGGYVDSHFGARFGAAIMISLIKDVADFVTAKSTGNTNSTAPTYSNTSSAASSMGQEVLKTTLSIPPTLTVNPATIVNVLVARDLPFDSLYKVIK